MSEMEFDYDELVQDALKGAIREVLQHVADHGLPGEHHFYITFDTNADGVTLPTHLKERYSDDMTIVLQHRYWGLKVDEERFELKLSFDGKPELLVIPFAALIAFVDPSAQFALQFSSDLYPPDDVEQDTAGVQDLKGETGRVPNTGEAAVLTTEVKKRSKCGGTKGDTPGEGQGGNDNVVALDTFRKNS